MERSKYLADRIRELFLHGKWIANTNYRELLSETNMKQALTRAGNHNSIASLTFHINYYLAGMIELMEGGELNIHDRFSFDMPPVENEEAWLTLRSVLLTNAEKIATLTENLPDDMLDTDFVKPEYGTWLRNLEAMLEHSYYHMGQISLIKKLTP